MLTLKKYYWVFWLALAIDCYYVLMLNLLATLLLMAVLLIAGLWLFTSAPRVWHNYKEQYRRASPRKKRSLGKPDVRYYYLNRYLAAPLLFAIGLLCAYLVWRLSH